MSKWIHVVAAVVVRVKGGLTEVLISKRPVEKHQGGLWEFPGGKLEDDETELAALKRELKEELDISIINAKPFIKVHHRYSDKAVLLDVYWIDQFSGEAVGKEGQQIVWVSLQELNDFDFPAANKKILSCLKVPQQVSISPENIISFSHKEMSDYLVKVIESGSEALLFREKTAPLEFYLEKLITIQTLIDEMASSILLIGNRIDLVKHTALLNAFHITSQQLIDLKSRPVSNQILLSAACHNLEQIRKAESLGCDFIFLSPIRKTLSHPNAEALGWDIAEKYVQATYLPCILLGGLMPQDQLQAKNIGAFGVAGIGAFGKQ